MILTSLLGDLDDDGILELVTQTSEALGQDPEEISFLVRTYQQLRRKRRRSRQELILVNFNFGE